MKQDIISSSTVFKITLIFNLISVIWNNIGDCDETYNYWEPLHFLIYGNGFQTWEYSPEFALRSYFFLYLYGWPAMLLKFVFPSVSKYVLFYTVRLYIMTIVSLLELYLYNSLKEKFKNSFLPLYCILFFVLSAGSFISITSFLPSSFALYCSIFAMASWLRGNYKGVIVSIASSAILGWPFSAAIGVPFAIDIAFNKCDVSYFINTSVIWGLFFIFISMVCDSYFYGIISFPSLNIIKYNVFNAHGSELYGTESYLFYIKNYLLNFNFCIILCAIYFIVVVLNLIFNKRFSFERMRVEIMVFSVISIWNVVFFLQPHKEERFLFPCYPFIAITSGIFIHKLELFLSPLFQFLRQKLPFGHFLKSQFFGLSVLAVFALINLSRILAIILSFNGSMSIYHHLNEIVPADGEQMLCLGREWHRFPSRFFLSSAGTNVSLIKSDFKGQLPATFTAGAGVSATRVVYDHFNDLNKKESQRYLHLSKCNFIIDRVDSSAESENEPNWESMFSAHWRRRASLRLLSPSTVGLGLSPWRSFYVPYLFEKMNRFVDYVLLERV